MSERDSTSDSTGFRSTDGARTGFQCWITETARKLVDADDIRIDVFVRSLLPPPGAKDAQSSVLGALRDAVADTPAQLRVQVWGERICRCDSCRDSEVGRIFLDRVETLTEWGDRYDASAGEYFEYTSQHSSVTGSTYEGIRPPRVTAVLYADGVVTGVAPNQFGDRHVTVTEFADLLPTLTERERTEEGLELSG
jgi:hypothetical protein